MSLSTLHLSPYSTITPPISAAIPAIMTATTPPFQAAGRKSAAAPVAKVGLDDGAVGVLDFPGPEPPPVVVVVPLPPPGPPVEPGPEPVPVGQTVLVVVTTVLLAVAEAVKAEQAACEVA